MLSHHSSAPGLSEEPALSPRPHALPLSTYWRLSAQHKFYFFFLPFTWIFISLIWVLFLYFADGYKEMQSRAQPASRRGAHMGLLSVHLRDCLSQILGQRSSPEHASREERGACPHHVR